MAKINRINPEGISKPFSNYSHVVTAEGAQKLVFCAGQVAADVDGKVLPPDDFDAQAKMVMANLTKALAAGGAKLSDVTKITIYLCNPHDVPKARGLLQTYFEGHPPGTARARQSEFSAGDRGDRRGVIFPGSGAVEGRVPAAVRAGTFHIIAP
jgi:enamine deaminase RidA (YjgF/YER057c/UK114 family)